MKKCRIVLSNGSHRFHTSLLGDELSKRKMLIRYITAGYPGPLIKLIDKKIPIMRTSRAWLRLLDREEPSILHEIVSSSWLSEVMFLCEAFVRRYCGESISQYIGSMALQLYRLKSFLLLVIFSGDIYHYRSGFGGISVNLAKSKGMVCVCDHSAAEPNVFRYLVNNNGKLPRNKLEDEKLNRFWRLVREDLEKSDYIVVNSDFIKLTMGCQGYNLDKIFSIYVGIDDKFYESCRYLTRDKEYSTPIRLSYAGRISYSKGFHLLVSALTKIPDEQWMLNVYGGIDADFNKNYNEFFRKTNVFCHGFVARHDLALQFSKTDVFVFPSLSEGSARVVFEAMACGCFVITSNNAGSVVEDGVNGVIIDLDNVKSLVDAIYYAINNSSVCSNVGLRNRELIMTKYTQSSYGSKMLAFYEKNCLSC